MNESHTTFIRHFLEVASLKLEADAIQLETEFAKLPGWDSLALVSLMIMADLEYGKKITVGQVSSCKTIAELYELCAGQ